MNHSKSSDPRFWQKWRKAGAVLNPYRYGMSVSLCISRIIHGEVPLEKVEKIFAGFRSATPEEWDETIKSYRSTYWRDNPDEGERIIRKFLAEGRVIQPLSFESPWAPQIGLARGVFASSWKDIEEHFKPEPELAHI